MVEPPAKCQYLMESYPEEHYSQMVHVDSLAVMLQSSIENSTKKAKGQEWKKSTMDSWKDSTPIESNLLQPMAAACLQ